MGPTDAILTDHQARKDPQGVAWFTAQDLARLGIDLPLMSTMQTVQHTLRMRRSRHLVETQGRIDAFAVVETH
jgi:hypothetical protein